MLAPTPVPSEALISDFQKAMDLAKATGVASEMSGALQDIGRRLKDILEPCASPPPPSAPQSVATPSGPTPPWGASTATGTPRTPARGA